MQLIQHRTLDTAHTGNRRSTLNGLLFKTLKVHVCVLQFFNKRCELAPGFGQPLRRCIILGGAYKPGTRHRAQRFQSGGRRSQQKSLEREKALQAQRFILADNGVILCVCQHGSSLLF